MPLQSMTGFSQANSNNDDLSWVWELRSVNSKGLDVRLRLPSGYEALEVPAKKTVSGFFSRGNIQISLQVKQLGTDVVPVVNQAALAAAITAAEKIRERVGGELPGVGELMSMRGIVEYLEAELGQLEREKRDTALINSLSEACKSLLVMRVEEGSSIVRVLLDQVSQIETLKNRIVDHPARKPEAIREQLKSQVARLVDANDTFDEQRLHQEAAVLAAKADLQEELDRLSSHVAAAKTHLNGEGPSGRKLDFLAQEFNRECNTICSKSNSADVTSFGLDMKLVIDQFREQIQNLE